MPAKSKAQQSAFGMALAARRGDIKPEELTGSAKHLFKDSTLSNSQLEDYTKLQTPSTKKNFGRPRRNWKRG